MVSPDALKNVMARVPLPVTVVTAQGSDGPLGLTVSAFSSVSAEPAIVLFCIDKATASVGQILAADGFTVNIMPAGTEDEVMRFATYGADKFGEADWSTASVPGAGPVLGSALASLECSALAQTEMGDHWVVYGSVAAVTVASAGQPLIWHDRSFAAAMVSDQ